MDRMKTFLKYALCVIGFIIFSEILINISLETTYRQIGRKDNIEQISIYQAQATKVNGRLKGTIYNKGNTITNKYLKIDFYSERDINLGSKYIDVSNMREDETREIEMYFKLQDVEYYNISFTDEKEEVEIELLPNDMTKGELILGTIVTMLILW